MRDTAYRACSVCGYPKSALFVKQFGCFICEGCQEDSKDATRCGDDTLTELGLGAELYGNES